jgi:hypothetical protein
MAMARIFKPLRSMPSDFEDEDRATRMGAQPVTNPPPSGPSPEAARAAQEEGWLALLELVFEETGWPDAEP